MLKRFFAFFFVTVLASMFFAAVTEAWNPKFKKQDIDKATKECQDGSPCKPELVSTEDDEGNFNLALLEDAKPNADSLIAGWCPARHCTEYLNDGFYNNCRSWITGSVGAEAWAEVDMGDVYPIKKVGIGSDHCGNYQDRFAKDFKILVATEYNKDSKAGTWEEVYDNKKGDEVHKTVYFEFKEVEARYVRIFVVTGGSGVRIDELEIYGGPSAVNPQSKSATCWGQIKMQD
ncbi:discoidin domain-containing protein [Candidatus Poribacteria bacterium]|nr:discoidin domain-containing protein [Candidatus Poribacteria bacterium]